MIRSQIEQLGDRAVVLKRVAYATVEKLIRTLPALESWMPIAGGAVFYTYPEQLQMLESVVMQQLTAMEMHSDHASDEDNANDVANEQVIIPVCYGGAYGPDLEEVAALTGLSAEVWSERHAAGKYTAEMLGFMPGFAYLSGLEPSLMVPRKKEPRERIPAGAVAAGGPYTGIYPSDSPGGWYWIGQTPLTMIWPEQEKMARIGWLDRVRFDPVTPEQFEAIRLREQEEAERMSRSAIMSGQPLAEVIACKGIAMIMDFGRPAHLPSGISWGGAADPIAMRAANMLAGNQPEAPVLEIYYQGPELLFLADAWVCWYGAVAEVQINGRKIGKGSSISVRVDAGDRLSIGALSGGACGYLGIRGGWTGERWLGSVSTALRQRQGGISGRPLKKGDFLAGHDTEDTVSSRRLNECQHPGALAPYDPQWIQPSSERLRRIRYLPTAQSSIGDVPERRIVFRVLPASDRMGIRLAAMDAEMSAPEPLEQSIPVCAGAIQCPPGGQLLILMADAQPTGGYPLLGHVIRADIGLLAMTSPGDELIFEPVSFQTAQSAWLERMRWLRMAETGMRLAGQRSFY